MSLRMTYSEEASWRTQPPNVTLNHKKVSPHDHPRQVLVRPSRTFSETTRGTPPHRHAETAEQHASHCGSKSPIHASPPNPANLRANQPLQILRLVISCRHRGPTAVAENPPTPTTVPGTQYRRQRNHAACGDHKPYSSCCPLLSPAAATTVRSCRWTAMPPSHSSAFNWR